MDDERRERGTTLLKALGTDGRSCPMHVVWRVSVLVGGEDIAYAEAHLERDAAHQTTSGTVVVLTATRAIFAVIGRSDLHNEPNENASTVAVHCWGRRALTSIGMDESNENSDWSWHHEWSDVWPHQGARAQLVYSDGATLTLPLDPGAGSAAHMSRLLPGLVEDLARP